MTKRPTTKKKSAEKKAPEAEPKPAAAGLYFKRDTSEQMFIASGCKTLDLALGGGWARRRIANIIGDTATYKTGLCIEAARNFTDIEKKGMVYYREAEYAFDEDYARSIGFPMDKVDLGDHPVETVEDVFEDLEDICSKTKQPFLYVIDSLDALSDRAEMARKIDEPSFGGAKAKQMSQLFRRLTGMISRKDGTLIVVSQIRDNIGAFFKAAKYKRSGGHALDFYASQIVTLANLGKVLQTVRGHKQVIAMKIKAKLTKNKIVRAHQESEFEIRFEYGINDARACVDWLASHNFLADIALKKERLNDYKVELDTMTDRAKFKKELQDLHAAVDKRWIEVLQMTRPPLSKYE